MDMVLVTLGGVAAVGAAIVIAGEVRYRRKTPEWPTSTGSASEAQRVPLTDAELRDVWFPPSLQHYWVPSSFPDATGHWSVFLGATRTEFAYDTAAEAIEAVDGLNKAEQRGKYRPQRNFLIPTDDEVAAMKRPVEWVREAMKPGQNLMIGVDLGEGLTALRNAGMPDAPQSIMDALDAEAEKPPKIDMTGGNYRRAIGMVGGEVQYERRTITDIYERVVARMEGWEHVEPSDSIAHLSPADCAAINGLPEQDYAAPMAEFHVKPVRVVGNPVEYGLYQGERLERLFTRKRNAEARAKVLNAKALADVNGRLA